MNDYSLFISIQHGKSAKNCISPQQAGELAKVYGINLPILTKQATRRNIDKDEWNRNLIEDFSSFEIIRRCVFFCLTSYRANDQLENKSGGLYQKLLKTPYEELFSQTNLIWETLAEWNMNSRGAQLTDQVTFNNSLLKMKPTIDELNEYQLIDFCNDIKTKQISKILLRLYKNLRLSKSNQFVTIAKTLHFFMPQVLIPLDRTYTVNYFSDYHGLDLPSNREYEKQVTWTISFHKQLAKLYNNHKDNFDELSMRTNLPVTKLLDDTLIGFAMYRRDYCQQFNVVYIMNNRKV